jgi:hypothetical protein
MADIVDPDHAHAAVSLRRLWAAFEKIATSS